MPLKLGTSANVYKLATGTRASWGDPDSSGRAAGASPGLTLLANVKDVEIPVKKTQADASTRASKGWKVTKGTLKDVEISLQAIYDTADALVVALKKAFLTDTTIALALLDGADDVAGTEGLWADFEVVDMNKGEKLEDVQMVTFTIKPGFSAVPPEWVIVTSGS